MPALTKWLGNNAATIDNTSWRADTPEALVQFMETGDSNSPRAELSSETTFVLPSGGVTAVHAGNASVDWLLEQQARRHDALDELLAAQPGR